MKSIALAVFLAALVPAGLNSQQRAATTPERLRAIHSANVELLKRQAATLEKLDALLKDANQIRIFTKRG